MDLDEALAYVAFGLSGECRLQVHEKSVVPYKWTLEILEESGRWRQGSTVGLMLVPFWKKTTVRMLRNVCPLAAAF